MKRYRLAGFFFNGTRALLGDHGIPRQFAQREREQTRQWLSVKHGELDLDAKLDRYLQFTPPNICVIVEYHDLLLEIADSFVCGHYYPALTGACCLGERIFNVLILRLRGYYTQHPLHKRIYRKESIQDWDLAIQVLLQWDIIDADLEGTYRELARIRNDSIHLKEMGGFRDRALTALKCIMRRSDRLFGIYPRSDIFFWAPGKIYIRKDKEEAPIVKEFFIPNCTLVGYKHSVRNVGESGQLVLVYDDTYEYENREVTDDEFRQLRAEWRASRDAGPRRNDD